MRKMFSKKQIQNMTLNYIEGFDEIELSGDLVVDGSISGNPIVEKMEGYSASVSETDENFAIEPIYAGIVKNGNKLTLVYAGNITKLSATVAKRLVDFTIPEDVGQKIIPSFLDEEYVLQMMNVDVYSTSENYVSALIGILKTSDTNLRVRIANATNLVVNTKYYVRVEATFLLSDNLIPEP